MTNFTVRIPSTFYDDHMGRLGSDECLWEELQRNARTVTVRMDRAGLDSLRKDAEWYADARNHDAGWPALVRSARATVTACEKAQT